MISDLLLEINKLNTRIFSENSIINAVCDFDLELKEKEILSIIGESGCGKTISMLSITNLLPKPAKILSGEIFFDGKNIKTNNEEELRKMRGGKISYVFQDATSSLNPLFCIGEQIREVFIAHGKISHNDSRKKVLDVLELVNLKPPDHYYSYFPHQLSGGMNQRVMIAMAIASNPRLLIADEPTSSLDRITEIKILNLLRDLNKRMGISIILITHNISIVENFSDSIAIMYAGRIIEKGSMDEILNNPKHPYTIALIGCLPKNKKGEGVLNTIKGNVPNLSRLPVGCKFNPRCPYIMNKCFEREPELKEVSHNHFAKCYLW